MVISKGDYNSPMKFQKLLLWVCESAPSPNEMSFSNVKLFPKKIN